MRRLAILAIVLGTGGASAAAAATQAGQSPAAQALSQAAFLPNASPAEADPIGRLLDHDNFAPGQGLVGWTTGESRLTGGYGQGPVDSLRIREGSLFGGPGELPLTQRAATDPKSYEIALIRHWPGALSFESGKLAVDVSPHAGLGVIGGDAPGGGSAEAGATVQLSKSDLAGERLKAMGVRDGASFGQQGRWYLFAAASGRAVGMNMLHGESGWNRAGWSTDATSKLVGDAQVGVGWRKGSMQTSLVYVRREVKSQHMMYGVDPKSDSMVAVSLSIRPHL